MSALVMLNGYSLIKPVESKTVLDNGLTLDEMVDRRSIIRGLCLEGPFIVKGRDTYAYFPMYAADSIVFNGEKVYIVKTDDIIMVERLETGEKFADASI